MLSGRFRSATKPLKFKSNGDKEANDASTPEEAFREVPQVNYPPYEDAEETYAYPPTAAPKKTSQQIVDEIRAQMTKQDIVNAPIQAYIVPYTDEHQVNSQVHKYQSVNSIQTKKDYNIHIVIIE